ncbi:MAG: hypothetical protein EOT05_01770 [Candidatus Microsaccharimonas sossegonensis]|uniref:Uncharacterized protein n=1 Tax=Candidatus Microsaccharimonas sossegonensis TaxID=2506948 RepID=A0A4V1J7F1_9BACT|nr:MAG: hypothetical protein EOT05_01770 [Candidatus Microsaccharimonas sossegonensis]
MDRKDKSVTVHQEWEANYNATGRATIDQSTTELSGTKREADLIVAGLRVLKAQKEMARVAESLVRPNSFGDRRPSLLSSDEVTKLIESIETPNYVAEPVVRQEYI